MITLREVLNACDGRYSGDELRLDDVVMSFEQDSRKVGHGTLFVAIKGERADGHNFVQSCYEKGAVCCLVEHDIDTDKPYIVVESTLEAIKKIAEYYREKFTIPVVSVSGSVGKTSTKGMIGSVLNQHFNTLITEGNHNNEIGVPFTLLRLNDKHEAAVIEMGISDFGEMTRLAKMVKPNIVVLTNIGIAHLENLKDRNGVLKAKTECMPFVKKGGYMVINGDDDKLENYEYDGLNRVRFGFNSYNDVRAENVCDLGIAGCEFDIVSKSGKVHARTLVPGRHMVLNALCAYAVGKILSVSDDDIVKGIESFRTEGDRTNVIRTDFVTVISDCYNANPVSTKASIDVLASTNTRTVAILGDMLELGDNENEFHRSVGEYAKDKGIDVLVCVGKLSSHMADGAKGGKTSVIYFETKEKLIASISDILQNGDTVLVKASHGMHLEQVVEKIKDMK